MISADSKTWSLLVPVALALAACQQDKAPEPAPTGQSGAAPDAKPGLTLANGVLKLPAVSGRPAAAYFTVANGSSAEVKIAAVHVDGAAKAEMHETTGGAMAPLKDVPVAPGQSLSFAPGGKHVMLFDLDPALKAGGKAELTLVFAGGDKASIPLTVEAAGGGDAMAAMPGMDHGH